MTAPTPALPSRRAAGAAALAALLLAGCLSSAPQSGPSDADDLSPALALRVLPPVLLTTDGPGFEPSIDAAPDGTLYAAAAKTARPNDGARLASWLWFSRDGGATWGGLPSPMGVHEAVPGLEGDTAVDGKGRFYFADTYLPDDALHRWSPGPGGPQWEWSRPITPTTAPVDDRPWLSAQGDGIVYLLSNNGADPPAPGGLLQGDASGSRIWLFASADGGLTWSLGHGFGPGVFCQVAASPADDHSVWVACADGNSAGAPLRVLESRDRGATWSTPFETLHELGTGYLAPVPAADRAGVPAVAWLDERVDWSGLQDVAWGGEEPGRVLFARPGPDGAWRSHDVTPFAGRFGMLHAAAGPQGMLAIAFYATEDLTPDEETEWRAYVLVVPDADAAQPAPILAPLLDRPVAKGAIPPRDLFECAVGPDDAIHAAVQVNRDEPYQPGDGIRADVFHVRVEVEGMGVGEEGTGGA